MAFRELELELAMRTGLVVLPAFVCLSALSQAFAGDTCGFLRLDPKKPPPTEGQMFVSTSSGWGEFQSGVMLGLSKRTKVRFAYVVSTSSGERTGVLVVKTNRPATDSDSADAKNRIRLVRKGVTTDRDCARVENFPSSWVSTRAYEDYHDFPAPDTVALRRDEKTIKAFHFSYWSDWKGRCARTDDWSYDEFPWNWNSNRAQFSFDRTVVAQGSYSAVRLYWNTPPSAFEGSADHRTQMIKYATEEGRACVPFSLNLDPGVYTFRINDLEGRVRPSPNGRSPERYFPVR